MLDKANSSFVHVGDLRRVWEMSEFYRIVVTLKMALGSLLWFSSEITVTKLITCCSHILYINNNNNNNDRLTAFDPGQPG